ncbi:NAD(P)-dependent dehydrogenase (short-subunit alcohol dehydrogenase family) [Kineococcus xinjiangensis]|uniref:NAD(P)-dependent dehydrogenase (Short-subunit alcohol dehydrogenase family) n=1 Tax=Kineococcus xinjiangensis TaxID=512762 RepID=A0A2S6IVM6_9ACTN|nr:SDR family oxidoreductase [Kineococcus xinjiangensis]PPK98203.1 NAD(P)-dependent dehydrogenase (short-subunit alcohol dehydrogenase family) [Kineococcus xinjiangensis]
MVDIVVITGGGRGIGAASARLLAGRGYGVCLSWTSQREAAEAVVADCVALEVPATAVRADVASDSDVAALFAAAAELGTVAGLVNNAGIVAPPRRVEELTRERVLRLLDVNVAGAFACAAEAVRRMSTARGGAGGAIVNVSSRAAVLGGPGEYVDYAASKAALDALTVGLAKEVAAEGIRVNGVRPGLIRTDIHASGGQPGRVERMQDGVPMGRGGEAHEVAEAVAWLLSDAASYVTGATLDVSGGR